ncbi:DUF2188 domain-containing protein [Mesorhizobium sp. M7A.F.Ca.MR.245.00.0.0]|uniref:DUF2188 domain-containing protein n=1 Tax=Mesorhizobium sp. M7A.F.Ca.MR.245.00.0.0 TaxID=2496778 RepID=UPI000FCADDB9|nr:DUF2188 domain-containing protein [Mesorhizobium sp. M7A.F.Ca.MR.245.00.0.0]RUV21760.1 DUF2188 domain-containing protein [Mesorhizobium sp. M7A.F.Ca.MR.245.00.0.0]RUV49458.1 DUF2188 domain-containing protein [Mesorhizobium sp. M7A.F.Ca.MR.228.00.0.0]
MTKLPTYTLSFDLKKQDWKLHKDGADRATKRFETKAAATAGGVLSSAIGKDGGSVRIEKKRGGYEEERTFPRDRDPKKTPG